MLEEHLIFNWCGYCENKYPIYEIGSSIEFGRACESCYLTNKITFMIKKLFYKVIFPLTIGLMFAIMFSIILIELKKNEETKDMIEQSILNFNGDMNERTNERLQSDI